MGRIVRGENAQSAQQETTPPDLYPMGTLTPSPSSQTLQKLRSLDASSSRFQYSSATYSTGRSIKNVCRAFGTMKWSGLLTIWTGCVAAVALVPDQSTFLSTCLADGAGPWMSPELLDPEKLGLQNRRPTMESDCYALGMVIYEVLSGQAPFPAYSSFARSWMFTGGIWNIWKTKPRERITTKDILQGLEGKPYPSRSPSDLNKGVVEVDADDQSDDAASESPRVFSRWRPRLTLDPDEY